MAQIPSLESTGLLNHHNSAESPAAIDPTQVSMQLPPMINVTLDLLTGSLRDENGNTIHQGPRPNQGPATPLPTLKEMGIHPQQVDAAIKPITLWDGAKREPDRGMLLRLGDYHLPAYFKQEEVQRQTEPARYTYREELRYRNEAKEKAVEQEDRCSGSPSTLSGNGDEEAETEVAEAPVASKLASAPRGFENLLNPIISPVYHSIPS